jgi:hypothetical protein
MGTRGVVTLAVVLLWAEEIGYLTNGPEIAELGISRRAARRGGSGEVEKVAENDEKKPWYKHWTVIAVASGALSMVGGHILTALTLCSRWGYW